MSNKVIMSICVDTDLLDVVNKLKANRSFSKFIQDCLRAHRVTIESESLENELQNIDKEMSILLQKQEVIQSELDRVKIEENTQMTIDELEFQLRELNQMKHQFELWENLPINKRPVEWDDLNKNRLAIGDKLRQLGFDFTRLRE